MKVYLRYFGQHII